MRRFHGYRPAHVAALLVGLSLAACADEESGPQFANDPAPTRPPTGTPVAASPVPLPTTIPAATPASLADLLASRGAPSQVFITSNNAIWSVTSAGEAAQVFEAPASAQIVAIDAAPGGQQVAALMRMTADDQAASDVVILDSAGETVVRFSDLDDALATPSPVEGGSAAVSIDWSPQGDRAFVSFQSGAIVELRLGEETAPSLIATNGGAGTVESPAWSPTGESIAFIASSDAGRMRSLQVLEVGDGGVAVVVAPPEGRFVVDFAWMPNGISLLFTEGGELGGAITGIDLWRVGANGENRELVVSAGTVAPVAQITNVRPAPDGRSVAYAVLVPGAAGPQVDSVWIRDLDSGIGFGIPLPTVASVDDIRWTDRGLAIAVTTRSTTPGRAATRALLQVNRDGSVVALWAAPVAIGTPVSGTPVATPVSP